MCTTFFDIPIQLNIFNDNGFTFEKKLNYYELRINRKIINKI